MAREFSKAFYNSKLWTDVREGVLMRDKYLCQKCGAPAEEVHHIIHLTPENIDNPNISMNPTNLTSLCRDCHFKQHFADKAEGHRKFKQSGRYEFDENGYLVPVKTPPVETKNFSRW